jgi:hypothetical protein
MTPLTVSNNQNLPQSKSASIAPSIPAYANPFTLSLPKILIVNKTNPKIQTPGNFANNEIIIIPKSFDPHHMY